LKRVWKPLDAGGLRLYEVLRVMLWKDGHTDTVKTLVMAKSPKQASALMEEIYKGAEWHPNMASVSFVGRAIYVLIPEAWWQDGIPNSRS
jgi:hypothetical protein